jgi:hypothetical protein
MINVKTRVADNFFISVLLQLFGILMGPVAGFWRTSGSEIQSWSELLLV